ncbi:MAG: phenylacetate--CoA ligase [Clostridium butyricum]|nr:phenylacetate--CoA ligase [Clostridium butyricum]
MNSIREEIEVLQKKRLIETVNSAYNNVELYRKKFDKIGLKPEHIKSLEDIRLLPFTTKQDLRDNYPYGMFAVPMDKIVRIHASSGTTGTQTVVGYTKNDIDIWSDILVSTLKRFGVTSKDIVQNSTPYGLFTGGLGLHYGFEKLGATVIPISGGNTEKQILAMKNFGVTVLCGTPSYALRIYDVMRKMGVHPEELKLRVGIFGAEPWSDEMRERIEKCLNIKAYDIYGLSEVMGPGVAGECKMKNGLHINEEYFLPEIINAETTENLRNGQKGELVLTTLTKEALPILRYRTRDITVMSYDKCECGCPYARIKRIHGRSDDMMIIRGVNIYPIQIEKILAGYSCDLSAHYVLNVQTEGNMDKLTIVIEMNNYVEFYKEEYLIALKKNILDRLYRELQIHCSIELVNPETLKHSEGKVKRVVFNRELVFS